MGICYADAKVLLDARTRGLSFDTTLTVGHQVLFLHPAETRTLKRLYKERFPDSVNEALVNYVFGDPSDQFLRDFLGVRLLRILDYSQYEGADLIQDLNEPVTRDLWNRFDAIIDGGSLEHVFNFPNAISSLMKMLKVGGSIFIACPANNLCGHGFYQFSPELMFRVFSEENGFQLQRVFFCKAMFPSVERTPHSGAAYEIADPMLVGRRVGLVSNKPVIMRVEAKKLSDRELFKVPPLQSDYLVAWRGEGLRKEDRFLRKLIARLPSRVSRMLLGVREMREYSLSNSHVYRKRKL
ncbi:MAG TPA: hypothetical protein VFW45_13105 [Candidatus Polarisedimenticolia bacterium]|nr:hypothetical protein [Candidatus Polarisedimenticolia bacterium]